MDQFMTQPHHLGHLNVIHADMLICSINTMLHMYPLLAKKSIHIFFEVNLSHDLAVCVERKVKVYYNLMTKNQVNIKWVKQHDRQGNLMLGVLTRHKANLVSYFKRAIDDKKIFIAQEFITIARIMELKYMETFEIGYIPSFPNERDMSKTLQTLVEQATMFRCYEKMKTVTYSGKKTKGGKHFVDDMLMSLILATAWARLPENSYILE